MAAVVLSAAISFPPLCCWSQRRASLLSSSPHMLLDLRSPGSHLYGGVPQLGTGLVSSWSGLKHLGISSRKICGLKKKKGKAKVVYASLFGVGAPEALVIGVVALLVFGPKGLAEVARNLGKTLRAFQPTIRELQEVSREFKSTLEREIGLDEVASSTSNTYRSTSLANEKQQAVVDPNGTTAKPYTSDELLKITEEQLATAATRSQTETSNSEEPPKVAEETTASKTSSTPAIAASAETPAQTPSSKMESERS